MTLKRVFPLLIILIVTVAAGATNAGKVSLPAIIMLLNGSSAEAVECASSIHGNPCDSSSSTVAPGWVCLDDGNEQGNGECRPACDALNPCSAPWKCLSADGGQTDGFCGPTNCADSFVDSDCGPSAKCVAWTSPGGMVCEFTGAGGIGSACSAQQDCAADLWCIGGSCVAPECSTDGTTLPCAVAGTSCQAFEGASTGFADAGLCATTCTPYAATECQASEWCLPSHINQTTGTCLALQGDEVTPSEPCTINDECPAEYVCIGYCIKICDAGATGTGGAGDTCVGLESCDDTVGINGFNPDYGGCVPPCTFHEGSVGCPVGEHCRMGEMLAPLGNNCDSGNPCPTGYQCLDGPPPVGAPADPGSCYGPAIDFCVADLVDFPTGPFPLAQGQSCDGLPITNGSGTGAWCGPNAQCIGNANNNYANTCNYFCSLIEGDPDADCPDGAVCVDTGWSYYFGECQ